MEISLAALIEKSDRQHTKPESMSPRQHEAPEDVNHQHCDHADKSGDEPSFSQSLHKEQQRHSEEAPPQEQETVEMEPLLNEACMEAPPEILMALFSSTGSDGDAAFAELLELPLITLDPEAMGQEFSLAMPQGDISGLSGDLLADTAPVENPGAVMPRAMAGNHNNKTLSTDALATTDDNDSLMSSTGATPAVEGIRTGGQPGQEQTRHDDTPDEHILPLQNRQSQSDASFSIQMQGLAQAEHDDPGLLTADNRPIQGAAASPSSLLQNAPLERSQASNPADNNVLQQINRAMVQQLASGERLVQLRLTPPELGTIRMEIIEQQGRLHVRIGAEDDGVRQSLDRILPQLRQELRQQLDQVIDIDQSDPSDFHQMDQQGHKPGEDTDASQQNTENSDETFSLDIDKPQQATAQPAHRRKPQGMVDTQA